MKYRETAIVLSEIPDHITLAINISGCPIHCPSCHSKYLWEDVGEELNESSLASLIENNPDVTCVCFMGGDNDPKSIFNLSKYIKEHYPSLAVGWYSGRPGLVTVESRGPHIISKYLDYIKLGPFDESKGPINKKTTNQKMYQKVKCTKDILVDITSRFWNQ